MIIAAGALALGGASCGDDDEGSSEGEATGETASAEEVSVVATEYDFELSATPTADTGSVTFDNQGEEFHVMLRQDQRGLRG